MSATIKPEDLVLTDDPEQQNEVFLRAFNSGEGAIFDSLYREDAISNLSGSPLTGKERTETITAMLAQKPRLEADLKHAYTAGDTMLVVVDYVLHVPDEQNGTQTLRGTCTDVLTRDADGTWAMTIDRPVDSSELD